MVLFERFVFLHIFDTIGAQTGMDGDGGVSKKLSLNMAILWDTRSVWTTLSSSGYRVTVLEIDSTRDLEQAAVLRGLIERYLQVVHIYSNYLKRVRTAS